MGKGVVKIKDWPFHKGEQARLIWIGEPFKQDNKFIQAYFKGTRSVKMVTLDWGSVHFLGIDRFYVDGNLNHGKTGKLEEIIDIQLDVRSITYNERDWIISGIGDHTTSKTWNAFKDGIHYTIPVIEVVKGILAPDQFTLYRILETDNFFLYLMYDSPPKRSFRLRTHYI